MKSIRTLMTGIIDYAGLFPPAGLDMGSAVKNYAGYRGRELSWMLSRFICPVGRFQEFEEAAGDLLPEADNLATEAGADSTHAHTVPWPNHDGPWHLSALCSVAELPTQLDAIFGMMDRLEGRVVVDALEIKIEQPAQVDEAINLLPQTMTPYFEFPLTGDSRGFITALSGGEAGAKIRTGGVTADLFPSCKSVASFIKTCSLAEVAYKATAGLHHPLRHFDESIGTEMHGFLNVFLAGLLASNLSEKELVELLEQQDATAFAIQPDGIEYRGHHLSNECIEHGRATRSISFGSCSFDEPIEDLEALGLL